MARSAPSPAPRLALLQEQRYRRHFLREDARQNAVVIAVVGGAFALAVRNEFVVMRAGPARVFSIGARMFIFVAAMVVVVLLRRARWPREHDRALGLAHFALLIAVIGTHLTRFWSDQVQGALIATFGLLVAVYFAQRGRLAPRVAVGSVISVIGVLLLFAPRGGIERPARTTGTLSLIALNLVGAFSARAFEEQRRRRFEAERRERRARTELSIRLRELALEKERAESLSRARASFLAAMSHEFRTPMNAVIGLSELLLDAPPAADHRGHARTIRDSARALLGMLEEILDFAKIDAQKLTLSPAPFDLRELSASVVDMLRPAAAARSLELSLDLSLAGDPCLHGDDARVRQVLVNLVSNGLKFTERGAVTLRVAMGPADGGDHHEVTFAVEDTGIGMDPGVIARLFQPFEQADGGITRRYGGTGLGLAISRQIVAAMGSDIHVESEPGRGSTFSFTLRLAAAAPPPVSLATRAEGRPPLSILVVDDHPINREVARAKLGQLGYAVDLASSGPEAIGAVSARDYDVVFMDLQMPEMSGIEATVQIGEATIGRRAPHVIAMTASVFEADREACRQAGMRDFVGKPVDLAQLDAVLRRVAEERGAAAPPLLSRGPLDRLHEIEVLGEPGFFATLCRIFLTDTHRRLPRMKEALVRGDAPELAREAHVLKSASATLGADGMSALSGDVEAAAREGRMEGIGAWLDALSVELLAVERALAREGAAWGEAEARVEGGARPAAPEAP